jgi:putative transcriptional regulator
LISGRLSGIGESHYVVTTRFTPNLKPTTSQAKNSRKLDMLSKTKPLSDSALADYEASRDLAADLLQAVREMKAGLVVPVSTPAVEARQKAGLSQSQFAALLGVSVRTLQGWEQGRKEPSGAARTLLSVVSAYPKIVLAVVTQNNSEPVQHRRSNRRLLAH